MSQKRRFPKFLLVLLLVVVGCPGGGPLDTTLPVVTTFNLSGNNPTTYDVILFELLGHDDVSISGWLVNESSTKPTADDAGFTADLPQSHQLSSGYGSKSVYAWAKDESGNVSDAFEPLTISYLEPGELLWEKMWDGDDGADDVPNDAIFVNSGDILVVGSTTSGGDSDWWIKKLTSDGDEVPGWSLRYDGTGNDVAYGVGETFGDPWDVVVVGTTNDTNWWLQKFLSSGARVQTTGWDNKVLDGGGGSDAAFSVAIDGIGNTHVAGFGESLVDAGSGEDWWLQVFQGGGTAITDWENHKFDGGSSGADRALSVAIDRSNPRLYFAGYLDSGAGDYDWWVRRFHPAGTETGTGEGWDKKIDSGGGADDRAHAVAVDTSGDVYVVGEAGGNWGIMRFASDDGAAVPGWDQTFDSGGADKALSVAVDSGGRAYVAGQAGSNWWIKKFQPDGTEITDGWDKTLDGGGDAAAHRVLVDQTGHNVYVIGYGTNLVSGTSGRDWWVRKYLDDRP